MAKDHITRLLADTSGFDSRVGESIRFVTNLHKSIEGLNNGMIGLSSQERSLLINMGKVQPAAKSAEVAIAQLEYIMNGLKASYEKMSIHTKISSDGKLVSRALIDVTRHVNELKAAMESMPKKAYVSPVTTFEPISGGAGAAGGAMVDGAGGGKNLFGKIMGGNLAARAVMDTLRFVKDTVKDAVQANMEFEYSNATLSAVLGKTKEEIMDLTIQAQKLGSTSLYSAKEISELQIVLARLGFNQTEIKDSTDAIAKLALATGVNLDRAAELTGASMRAFGYSTKEAARVASVLGVATTKSALDMEKLRTAMGYASSSAAAAGFEIEEVVAMLGKMVDRGQQATTAGVNIRNIMLDLNSSSSKLRKAIKIATGRDNIRGFEDLIVALREMRDAGINLDDVAATIQRRVTPGFLNLLANTEGVHDLAEELKGCTGELDAMAEKMEDTARGAAKELSNSWNALMLTFSNSNGTLKETLQWLDSIIDRYTRWRQIRQGGEMGVEAFRQDQSKITESARNEYDELKNQGLTDEQITEKIRQEIVGLEKQEAEKTDWYNYYVGHQADGLGGGGVWATPIYNFGKTVGAPNIYKPIEDAWEAQAELEKLQPEIAKLRDEIEKRRTILAYSTPTNSADGGNSISGNAGLGLAEKLNGTKDTVETALKNYALAVNEAKMEYEAGMIGKKQYDQKILNAMESVYKAYGTAAYAIADPKLKKELTDALNDEQTYLDKQFQMGRITQEEYDKQVQKLTDKYADLTSIIDSSDYKQQFNAWAKKVENQAGLVAQDDLDDKVAQAKEKYYKALNLATLRKDNEVIDELGYSKQVLNATTTLTSFYEELANENPEQWGDAYEEMLAEMRKWSATVARLTEEANQLKSQKGLNMRILRGLQGYAKQAGIDYETAGLSGKKEAIDAMQLGGTIDWSGAVNTLNQYLAKKNFQISVDLETGSIEKIKDQLAEALSDFKSGLGAVKTLVNFPNELKQAFEGLAETMEDGASAWDTMFAVFNTGFTILESVAGVMEAINTLQTLGNTLSGIGAVQKAAQTATTTADTIATKTNTAAHIENMQSQVASSHAWMGLAGIGIAAAVIAGFMALIKSTEYHANGGMVGMDGLKPRGTDVVPAMLTPGEVVLSHAMTNNLAGELQGAGRQMVMVQVSGRVSGKDILLAGNNYNRARGGSRGAYTKIK